MTPFAVAELRRFGPPGAAPDILIEVPHGATRRNEFAALAALLRGALPEDLEAFFHVNTDEGAPELALETARRVAARGFAVTVLRCRLARTLVDTNRVLASSSAGMTAGLPGYLGDPQDRRLLADLHAAYTAMAEAAYAESCGRGGLALALHTYAPRAVEIDLDADIAGAIRRAYRPARYRGWSWRPPTDFITEDASGDALAPLALVDGIAARLGERGIDFATNSSYRLHRATMGYRHAARWPGSVLSLEVRRDLLASPWRPFEESPIGPRKVSRLAGPIADGIADWLASRAVDRYRVR